MAAALFESVETDVSCRAHEEGYEVLQGEVGLFASIPYPMFGYPASSVGSCNHQVGYPKKGVRYPPTLGWLHSTNRIFSLSSSIDNEKAARVS